MKAQYEPCNNVCGTRTYDSTFLKLLTTVDSIVIDRL